MQVGVANYPAKCDLVHSRPTYVVGMPSSAAIDGRTVPPDNRACRNVVLITLGAVAMRNFRLFIGATAALAIVMAAAPGAAAPVGAFSDFSLTGAGGGTSPLPGRIYSPPSASPTNPRPLVLFLHGAGESGTNNTAQINGNVDNLYNAAVARGFYLYAPQTNIGWTSTTATTRVS